MHDNKYGGDDQPEANEETHKRYALDYRGWLVNPVYHPLPNPRFQGNPLIEALGPSLSKKEAARTLMIRHKHSPSMRASAEEVRIDEIASAFRTVFVPLNAHLHVFRSVNCLIRTGYQDRNPLVPGFQRSIDERLDTLARKVKESDDLRDSSGGDQTALGYGIFGDTGMGKTCMLRRILKSFPPVICHNMYRGERLDNPIQQLVSLWITCPREGSLGTVCKEVISTVDKILGTHYKERYARPRASVDDLMLGMAAIAARHYLGALVLDNLEHLSKAKTGGIEALLAFLVELADLLGIPIILVSTPRAIQYLDNKATSARRFMSEGDFFWRRPSSWEDPDWKLLVTGLYQYQYTVRPNPLTDDVMKCLFEVTQGLTFLVPVAISQAQRRAIELGIETVTPDLIKEVSDDSFNLPRKALEALRSGDDAEIRKWPDFFPPLYTHEKQRIRRTDRTIAFQREAQASAPAGGAGTSVSVTMDERSPSVSASKPRRRAQTPRTAARHPDALPNVKLSGEQCGLSAYDALMQAGMVSAATQFQDDEWEEDGRA